MSALVHGFVITLAFCWGGSLVVVALAAIHAPVKAPDALEQATAIVRACMARDGVAR